MRRRASEETLDHAYAATHQAPAYCLSIARGSGAPFLVLLPASGALRIGRDRQADLRITSPSLSRLHFVIEWSNEAPTLRDLGSKNGTFLEGAAIGDDATPFGAGAEARAGDVRFALLRLANVPHGARPLLTQGAFESKIQTASEDLMVAAVELASPLGDSAGALDVLSRLPDDVLVAMVSDDALLVAAREPAIAWLFDALVHRGIAMKRRLMLPARTPDVLGSIARVLDSPEPAASDEDGDVPTAFRYPSLRKAHEIIRRIAPRGISVLVNGETGTGKEVVAREIHRLSGRSGPLVAVNAAALPENLIESELFGHERGAFTGAQGQKVGLIESSHGGTLFLDEIGELSLSLQAKLLRVLEDQTVRRVGSNTERKVDLRVVAATHQDLEVLSKEKKFRQDLLYRLNGAVIVMPPLRDRKKEIGALASRLLVELATSENRSPPLIDAAALAAMEAYDWPGNVRELKHVLERALAFVDNTPIAVEHLPERISSRAAPTSKPAEPPSAGGDVRASVRDFERERILQALKDAGGNRTRAAELLGLPRRTLVYKLSKMRLDDES